MAYHCLTREGILEKILYYGVINRDEARINLLESRSSLIQTILEISFKNGLSFTPFYEEVPSFYAGKRVKLVQSSQERDGKIILLLCTLLFCLLY